MVKQEHRSGKSNESDRHFSIVNFSYVELI